MYVISYFIEVVAAARVSFQWLTFFGVKSILRVSIHTSIHEYP